MHFNSTSFCERPLIILLIQGLQYIHSVGLVHLDIKPDNIFISLTEPHLPVAMDTIMEDKCSEDQDLVYKIGKCQPTYLVSAASLVGQASFTLCVCVCVRVQVIWGWSRQSETLRWRRVIAAICLERFYKM